MNTCDNRTIRKSAPFQIRANLEPLCDRLQDTIRFFRVLLSASPTASPAGHLPLIRCPESMAKNRTYHVPKLADVTRLCCACPFSVCLSPGSAWTTCPQSAKGQPATHLLVRA